MFFCIDFAKISKSALVPKVFLLGIEVHAPILSRQVVQAGVVVRIIH